MVFAVSKPSLLLTRPPVNRLGVHKSLGAGYPDPPQSYPVPSNIMLSNKKGEEGSWGSLPPLAQELLDTSLCKEGSECLPLHPVLSFSLLPLSLIKPFLSQLTRFLAFTFPFLFP